MAKIFGTICAAGVVTVISLAEIVTSRGYNSTLFGKSSDGTTVKWTLDRSSDKQIHRPHKDPSVGVLEGKDFSIGLDSRWEEN
jgi:hypothetical protein